MANAVFNHMTARVLESVKMELVAFFISDGIGEIKAECIVMDCDISGNVFTWVCRLSDNILLSVSKLLSMMDHGFYVQCLLSA